MKKGFLDHIYARIKRRLIVKALFSGTRRHVGQGISHHLQINVPEKGGTQQKGCAAASNECLSSGGEENVLGSITLFHTVILVSSLFDSI